MKKFLLGYCGPHRSRRDRASTCSRSGSPSLHQGAPAGIAPIYNWTGFYIGGHVGGAFGGDNSFTGHGTSSNDDGRFLGGVQVGADYQFAPNWVLGVEGQYSWLGSNNNGVAFPGRRFRLHQQPAWPRLGHRPHRLHLGSGAALRQGRLCLVRPPRDPDVCRRAASPSRSNSSHHDGYTVGAGLEYMFAPELVGQGRVPVLRLRQDQLRDARRRWPRSATSATTSTP